MQNPSCKLEIIPKELEWIDMINPTSKEVYELAKSYHLDKKFLRDCLEPEHLPKLDRIGHVQFLVLRIFDPDAPQDADNVRTLTRKIAVFFGNGFILTIHRVTLPSLQKVRDRWTHDLPLLSPNQIPRSELQFTVLYDLIELAIQTYQPALENYFDQMELWEKDLLSEDLHGSQSLMSGHYLKRKITLLKRLIRMHAELIDKLTILAPTAAQDHLKYAKTQWEKWYHYADDLSENVQELLSHRLALSAQKTNEASQRTNRTVQMLTVLSFYFLPLNLIVGFFGMNFVDIPGYNDPWGKWMAITLLVSVMAVIYFWIRTKRWLDDDR